jgi:hypothetical protein
VESVVAMVALENMLVEVVEGVHLVVVAEAEQDGDGMDQGDSRRRPLLRKKCSRSETKHSIIEGYGNYAVKHCLCTS